MNPKSKYYRNPTHVDIFNAQASDAVGVVQDVRGMESITLEITTDGGGTAAGTMFFLGADSDEQPTFTNDTDGTRTNPYVKLAYRDLNLAGVVTAGDTPITWSSADKVYLVEINVSAISWFVCDLVNRTAGNFSAKIRGVTYN